MIKTYYELGKQWGRKNSSQSFVEKLKISLLSIIVGVLLGFVILGILGYNPLTVFGKLFTSAFQDEDTRNITLTFTAVYTLSGLANAFAFKTGLFNIGVSGQMLAGGAVAILLGVTVFSTMAPAVAIPLLLIIAIGTAALVGLLAGMLKAYLNVHEVVSTILLNWIIFYLIKYLFSTSRSYVDGAGNSNYLNRAHWFGGAGSDAWVSLLVFALVIVFLAFFILKFTTFGKKLSMTGLNKDASKYSGINVKMITITSLVISAGIAGALGFIFYGGYKHFIPRLETTIPTWGFDGIAIALLAFSLPLAVPVISFVYAIFKAGAPGSGIDMGIANETISLIFSIIIFTAAASSVFLRFRPFAFIKYLIRSNKSKEVQAEKEKTLKLIEKTSSLAKEDAKKEIKNIKSTFKFNKQKMIEKEVSSKIKFEYESSRLYVTQTISKFYNDKINELIFSTQSKASSKNHKKEIKAEMAMLKDILSEKVKTFKAEGNQAEIDRVTKLYNDEIKIFENSRGNDSAEINELMKIAKEKVKNIKTDKKQALIKAKKSYVSLSKDIKNKEELIVIGKKVLKEEVTNAYI